MPRKTLRSTFVAEIRRQLLFLCDPQYNYGSLRLHVSGVPKPWEFTARDTFEFHEDTGVLIVRDGPSSQDGHDNEDVPEYVFRLDAIVATQLA